MFILASQLTGLPIASLDDQSKVGVVRGFFVDPENGRLLGFDVQTGMLQSRVLAWTDILETTKEALITQSSENLVPLEEVLRIQEIKNQGYKILGAGVETENGEHLGQVEDFLIDFESGAVDKYYIKGLFKQKRTIPSERVIKIVPGKIIVQNNEPVKVKAKVSDKIVEEAV